MRKIMFNDKYKLTKAVLEGWKTMTRRIVSQDFLDKVKKYQEEYFANTLDYISMEDAIINMIGPERLFCNSFKIGEIVAISQSYKDIYNDAYHIGLYGRTAGWTNKMFVRADDMPHHIKITNIRVERLQEISDEDCLREGVDKYKNGEYIIFMVSGIMQKRGIHKSFRTPREAFAALIDKVSGRGTWDSNPLVWVYEFKLVN